MDVRCPAKMKKRRYHMSDIKITGANEGNLKHVSLRIPKNKLVVFTGLSGSGKSTLLIDVLFQECQRQYLEAITLEGIHKPDVESVKGASPAILISQTDGNRNPRSTVGTQSDIYTDLRMIYEKLGVRTCPHCGGIISAADCREETEKINADFYVYMYCSKCGRRMDKITRTYFSFNTKEGACPACEGLGKVHTVKKEQAVDESLSLENGAVRFWEKQYGKYQTGVLYAAFGHYGILGGKDIPVERFSEIQKEILYNGIDSSRVKTEFPRISPSKTAAAGRFEGVLPILWRRLADKNGEAGQLEAYFDVVDCPDCKGERLCELSRNVTVNGTRLPELSFYSLEQLEDWIRQMEVSLAERHAALVNAYIRDIKTKLNRFIKVGLGYLSLDRQIVTLSGGELQRLRLAAALDSELSGVIYILDEPTAGLHPKDTAGLLEILKKMRDLENTVLVIEHDTDIMAAADYIIDIGPGSGRHGGEIIASGTLEEIMRQKSSVTGTYLLAPHPGKQDYRSAQGKIRIQNAVKYNLDHLSADIPVGCFTAITGPSGSGKSTLIFEVLAKGRAKTAQNQLHTGKSDHLCPADSSAVKPGNQVKGLEQFDNIIEVGQAPISKMKRSNAATYSGVYTEIRAVFAKTESAKKAGLTSRHFSFNTPGGRCENCQGLGYVDNNMLFFADTKAVCPVCSGNQFQQQVLSVKYKGLSIKATLDLSIEEAAGHFEGIPKISKILGVLQEAGLGYLQLGQSLTTLSGGECQRLKLAKELIGNSSGRKNLYLMDEPTTGLHPIDIEHFLKLLNRITDAGNTVVVVEHNQQLIQNSDWIIDLGPGGGTKGGQIMFMGIPDGYF